MLNRVHYKPTWTRQCKSFTIAPLNHHTNLPGLLRTVWTALLCRHWAVCSACVQEEHIIAVGFRLIAIVIRVDRRGWENGVCSGRGGILVQKKQTPHLCCVIRRNTTSVEKQELRMRQWQCHLTRQSVTEHRTVRLCVCRSVRENFLFSAS